MSNKINNTHSLEIKNNQIKPKIVVSRCLCFSACRWNGVTIHSEVVSMISPYTDILTVCPEVDIGLGVPREPIRIIRPQGKLILFQPATNKDISQKMEIFSGLYLQGLKEVNGFILKSKSPSCGYKDVKIYPRAGKVAVAARGAGFFGSAVLKKFPNLAIEDEARLANFRIREHFFTKLFSINRFFRLKKEVSMKKLVQFHSQHKLIFMAYSQTGLKSLGKIVANHERKTLPVLIFSYQREFNKMFDRMPRYTSHINVVMHAFGYISKKISGQERLYFLDTLENYRQNQIPLSEVLGIMKAWLIRFGITYLLDQYYFQPYPSKLTQITDSGKGRNLKA